MFERRTLLIALLFGMLTVFRVFAPSDLLEGDQVKQVGYIMDILQHGHWVVQYEITGEVATKPPLYNWLAASLSLITGSTAEWVMKFPSWAAAVLWLWSLHRLACWLFDERVAFYACLSCIASHHFAKLMWFARTDMLLASLVLFAVAGFVMWRWTWWKSPALGFIVALSFLAKGPLGPALFLLFLLAWGWHTDALRSPTAWKRLIPGTLVFLLVAGSWLVAALYAPHFKHTAIDWQLGARMLDPEKVRPFYYYIGHLFTRIAPWPLAAVMGISLARQKNEWANVTFVLTWFALQFCLLSLIPVKRHDHLLPIYPAVFLLSGVGLRYLVEPVVQPAAFWVLYPVSALLAAMPVLWGPDLPPMVVGMTTGAFLCGAAATWCYLQRQRISLAVIAAGLICLHGIYHHHWQQSTRSSYGRLLAFVEKTQRRIPLHSDVVVFQAHPLIAYELHQHIILPTLQDLSNRKPAWIIMPDYFAPVVTEETGWTLTPHESLTLEPREERATLYYVEPPAQLTSNPNRSVH